MDNIKASKKELRTALYKNGVEWTDNKFIVAFESDDCGNHVVIKVERNTDDTTGLKDRPDTRRYMGWRYMFLSVPEGYLSAFYNPDGSEKTSKSHDSWDGEGGA